MSDDQSLVVPAASTLGKAGLSNGVLDGSLAEQSIPEGVIAGQLLGLAQDESEHVGQLIVSAARTFIKCDGGFLSVYRRGAGHVLYSARIPKNLAMQILNANAGEGSSDESALRGRGPNIALSQMHLGPDVASIREEEPWSKRSYICQVVLRKTRDEIWLLNLVRLNSMEQFGAAEVRILEQLEPFFDTLMQRMDAAAQSSLLGVAGWNILNSLCLGVALLESEGHIKAANSKAWAILRGRDGLEVKNDRVVATNALDNERFRNALREINTQRDISNRALIVERASSGMGLQLILVRLTPLTEWASAKGPQVALFIADPTLVNGTECLRELYGLTRVEAEIANLICRGFNPNEVADKLRMSIHTVRGYLKPMFRKMGARRQADILRIVAAGLGLVNAGTKPSEVALWRQESIVSDGLVPGLLAPGKKVAEITAERRVRTRRQMLTRTKRW